jgi:hypothetical protein
MTGILVGGYWLFVIGYWIGSIGLKELYARLQ